MSKKKKFSFWEQVMNIIVGTSKKGLLDSVKEKVSETMEEAEERLERAIKKVLSITAVFLIVFIGFIFVLVGLAKFLTESVTSFNFGVGYIIVGAGIIILALLFRIGANR